MGFLRFLESIRTPFLTGFFSLITHCGSELFFVILAVTIFWCSSKRNGHYLLLVGFMGTIVTQAAKLWFRIPRPWVLDPGFTVVEAARAAAGGYSFPSGHTQNIVGTMACLLLLCREYPTDPSAPRTLIKKRAVQAIAVSLMLLVPFSRMYLGCHTPLDVGASFVLALFLAFLFYPAIRKSEQDPALLWKPLLGTLLASILFLAFVTFYRFPPDIDAENLHAGVSNAWILFGCITGFSAAKALDDRYLHFPTDAVWWAQILKVSVGLALMLLIRSVCKTWLCTVLPPLPADCLRYFLMVFFAGAVWPLTFSWFSRIGKEAANA